MIRVPSYDREAALRLKGYTAIAGVDEVGRGPLAGPVMAAAVILSSRLDDPWVRLVRDSKLLTPRQRETAHAHIVREAVGVGVGAATSQEIDAVGIAPATRLAMARALGELRPTPDALLIDALTLPEVNLPQQGIIHGDRLCLSIAAASIVAKVTRDRLMIEQDQRHPGYGFARHKGYPTPEHLGQLQSLGPSPIHRRSFAPVRDLLEGTNGRQQPRSARARLGAWGEALATAYLRRQGYAILATNYRCPEGEMDIVAQEGDTLVFVEVRTRRSRMMGTPAESVTAAKRGRLITVAQRFIQEHPESSQEWRIDVIAIEMGRGKGEADIEHLKYAVTAD